MRFVSPALKHIVFPALARSGYLRHRADTGPMIITYHGVFPNGYAVRNPALDGNLVHSASLRQQLRLLKKRYHVLSPDDFLLWSEGKLAIPPRSMLLTCDDALGNTLTEMLPLLQEVDVSCLFFATGLSAEETPSMLWYEKLYLMLLDADSITLNLPEAGLTFGPASPQSKHACWWELVRLLSQFDGRRRNEFLDEIRDQLCLPSSWDRQFFQNPILAARFLTLDRDGIQRLAAAGMSIGAHTLSHPILARAPRDVAWREISESRSVLEKTLGKTVWAFGYPFGTRDTVTERDYRLAEDAGFRFAFMNTGGGLSEKFNPFALPRIHVAADMGLSVFEAHVSGFYDELRNRLLGSAETGAEQTT